MIAIKLLPRVPNGTSKQRLMKATKHAVMLLFFTALMYSGSISLHAQTLPDFESGTGTPEDPFLISTTEHLNNIRFYDRSGAWFELANDIIFTENDFSPNGAFFNDGKGWEPIGSCENNERPFSSVTTLIEEKIAEVERSGLMDNTICGFLGNVDGAGFKIQGVRINQREGALGVFGAVDRLSALKAIGVEDIRITNPIGGATSGGFIGINFGSVNGIYTTGEIQGQFAGGVVGANFGNLGLSYSLAEVIATEYGGGVLGALQAIEALNVPGMVEQVYAAGPVSSDSSAVSGIVGLVVPDGGNPSVTGAFYDTSKTGVPATENNEFGTGLSTVFMTQISTFEKSNWNISESDPTVNWRINFGEQISYPYLNFLQPSAIPGIRDPFFSEGSGTEDDPFIASSPQQLDNIRLALDAFFELGDDIIFDAADFEESGDFYNNGQGWLPIGSDNDSSPQSVGLMSGSTGFSGNFDGNGFLIKGLFMNQPNTGAGFFSEIEESGAVSNVGFEAVDFSATTIGGVAYLNKGTIQNIFVSGQISGQIVGGISAINEGLILNSYTGVTLTANLAAAGISVANESDNGAIATIQNTYAYGLIDEVAAIRGGVVIDNLGGSLVLGSFWDTETTTTNDSDGGTGLQTELLQLEATFVAAGWDFSPGTGQWAIIEGLSYPFLQLATESTLPGLILTAEIPGPEEGWRMLGSPGAFTTYGQLLEKVWTQGFAGASTENGLPNVLWYSESDESFEAPDNISNIVGTSSNSVLSSAANGFIVYVYDDTNYDGDPNGFPKVISTNGTPHSGTVTRTLTRTTGLVDPDNSGWHIVSNPYPFPISWNLVAISNPSISLSAYVWDANRPGGADYIHTGVGGGWDGEIAPFQAFWVEALSDGAELTFEETDESLADPDLLSEGPETEWLQIGFESADRLTDFSVVFDDYKSENPHRYDVKRLPSLTPDFLHIYMKTKLDSPYRLSSIHLERSSSYSIELPVYISSTIAGEMDVFLKEMNLPEGFEAILSDTKTGESVSVSEGMRFSIFVEETETVKMTSENGEGITDPLEWAAHLHPGGVALASSPDPRFILQVTATPTSTETGTELPEAVSLSQNYPNPFNPVTRITYSLPEAASVQLTVYNMLGQLVAVLVNQDMQAGMHTANFDGTRLSSGMYIYRLQLAGEGNSSETLTRKMMLVK
ncbi:MAG: T9SS type A sorting domain-containing protein [Balneolales bacterium]|nr:T9SS type A sorting domain-containing protein [Balneolales bacterium]